MLTVERKQLVENSLKLYDSRTTLEKVRLSSIHRIFTGPRTQVLLEPTRGQRQHILVTGGYGSLGRHVVRDLLLFGQSRVGLTGSTEGSAKDVIVTILDVRDGHDELDFMLRHLPRFHRNRSKLDDDQEGPTDIEIDYVDPRSRAFANSMVSVDAFVRSGRLHFARTDVRNLASLRSIFFPQKYGAFMMATHSSSSAPHRASTGSTVPPISGVIHLAGYSQSTCILNLKDCADVLQKGTKALADVLTEFEDVNRPWLVNVRGPEEVEVVEEVCLFLYAYLTLKPTQSFSVLSRKSTTENYRKLFAS